MRKELKIISLNEIKTEEESGCGIRTFRSER